MTASVNAETANPPPSPDVVGRLAARPGGPAETLQNIVVQIRERFGTDVCSVYFLEPDRATLVLASTVGLRPESVGKVRMPLSEGLAGMVAEGLKPVVVEDAPKHPRFKHFREAGEDALRSFLGVPLVDQGMILGCLVLQTLEARDSSPPTRSSP